MRALSACQVYWRGQLQACARSCLRRARAPWRESSLAPRARTRQAIARSRGSAAQRSVCCGQGYGARGGFARRGERGAPAGVTAASAAAAPAARARDDLAEGAMSTIGRGGQGRGGCSVGSVVPTGKIKGRSNRAIPPSLKHKHWIKIFLSMLPNNTRNQLEIPRSPTQRRDRGTGVRAFPMFDACPTHLKCAQ